MEFTCKDCDKTDCKDCIITKEVNLVKYAMKNRTQSSSRWLDRNRDWLD